MSLQIFGPWPRKDCWHLGSGVSKFRAEMREVETLGSFGHLPCLGLFQDNAAWLPDDKLTIVCEVTVLGGPERTVFGCETQVKKQHSEMLTASQQQLEQQNAVQTVSKLSLQQLEDEQQNAVQTVSKLSLQQLEDEQHNLVGARQRSRQQLIRQLENSYRYK